MRNLRAMPYRTTPQEVDGMPSGIPHIIGNEAAERFSFYGMKAILAVFMVQYLHLMNTEAGKPMGEAEAASLVHLFNGAFYLTPFIGAILADVFWGKYRTIIWLSLVYCAGHAALALMGKFGDASHWLIGGLVLIALGSGGIKPCVSAHVGDQFGTRNHRLLPRIFNWFYFSINLGAFVSMLLTPWLLEWYGPHWAFGVPGVLMAIATLIFWMGRKRFAHVPANGPSFIREAFGKEGLVAMLKLAPIYLFVAMFWALFDQTGSTWIFQSQDMDRNFLGFTWLPSQIQSLNSVFVLTFIPLFSFFIYPWVDRFWPLSPLRKMGVGFILMFAAFVMVSMIQVWIDGGERPNIKWQIGAFALLTAAEILVSIVALEFAYTQAPKTMKSFIMCFYLAAVAIGNFFVAGVNHWIQIPSAAEKQFAAAIALMPQDWQNDPRTVVLPGYDGITGTGDDFVKRLEKGADSPLEVPGLVELRRAATAILSRAGKNDGQFPADAEGNEILQDFRDFWGRDLRYQIQNSNRIRIWSRGGDNKWNTEWDIGIIIEKPEIEEPSKASWMDKLRPQETWLDRRKAELNQRETGAPDRIANYTQTVFSGGQVKLQGAEYFWFFSGIMGATALLFIPLAFFYRPKTYIQGS